LLRHCCILTLIEYNTEGNDPSKPLIAMSLEAALKAAADVEIPEDILNGTAEDIAARTRLIENEIKMLQMEAATATSEKKGYAERLKDNKEKIRVNTQLPYLVGNVVEVRSHHCIL
jgi:ATP-dependent 26S proteasome regulatory subunit